MKTIKARDDLIEGNAPIILKKTDYSSPNLSMFLYFQNALLYYLLCLYNIGGADGVPSSIATEVNTGVASAIKVAKPSASSKDLSMYSILHAADGMQNEFTLNLT